MERANPKAVFLVKLVLRLLSFRIGTLLLCGNVCFDWRWPFFLKFSEISLEKRERILKNWSMAHHKYTVLLRMTFMIIKIFCCFKFFSRVTFSFNSTLRFLFTIILFWCSYSTLL